MKKTGLTLIFAISTYTATAIETNNVQDDNNMYTWQAFGPLGLTKSAHIDTSLNKYHIEDLALKRTVSLQHLGNAGSPGISRILSDRSSKSNFIFFQPYSLYYTSPEDILYFNTKKPYTNISYSNGGLSNRKQEHVSGIFSVNVNPHLNIGMYGKWQNNYGAYDNQSTKNYNAGFQGSYINRHHECMANISFNGYRTKENGGLLNTGFVTDPKNNGKLDSYNIPTYFDDGVDSKLVNWNAYFNYKYNFGFDKTTQTNEDSTTKEFIPVSSIIYSFRNEVDYKRYKEDQISNVGGMGVDSLYRHLGIGATHLTNNKFTTDSVHFRNMKHTIGLSLNEEFNTFGKFGIAGYLSFDQKQYGTLNSVKYYTKDNNKIKIDSTGADSTGKLGIYDWGTTSQSKVGIGTCITKRKGEHLNFFFGGEYYFKDEKETGKSFKLEADINSRFNIGKNIFSLSAKGIHEQSCPDYLEEHYLSNRLRWDYDFKHKRKTTLEASLGAEKLNLYSSSDSSFLQKLAPELGLILKANETTLSNYIYWGTEGTPRQHKSNIAITSLSIQERFKIWYLHFDNELTLQHINANPEVLDLPSLCLFSDLYLKTKPLFKVLSIRTGVNLRYNSSYYAPAYLPATGMFYAQNKEELGDYPFYNAYLSMHLKTFRVFLEYSHINHAWSNNNNYIITPGYANDPNYIRFGVSVNFAN